MKRWIRILSLTALAVGLIQLGRLMLPEQPANSSRVPTGVFRQFPVGHVKNVEFEWGGGSLRHLNQREEKDQALDWLMLALLPESGFSQDEISKLTFDLPPVRAGYFQAIGSFEYGSSRSRYLGNGQVLALVPRADQQHRACTLARIADEHRKNTGSIPKTLIVFEYDLDPDYGHARLTRQSDVAGQSLYSGEAGYVEKRVQGLAQLNEFLAATSDLTYARVDDGVLVLGGRVLPGRTRSMTSEDVAALWQSEQALRAHRAEVQSAIDAFNAKWDSATYSTEAEKAQLTRQHDKEEAELKARLGSDREAKSSGFSLDPTFDYEGLSQDPVLAIALMRFAPADEAMKIETALRADDENPLFEFLDQLSKKDNDSAHVMEEVVDRHKFQAARYDGSLQGTEVGMTLFYTDLLAKLKALDFWREASVANFIPLTQVHLSPVYNKEVMELNNTRLWFGPRDQGFQKTSDSILFARNATRVYAASSQSFTPGKEVEPNAQSAAFLGWWNDHYEEVAAYEPEYQRLNEIMKWSLLITWMNQNGSSETLSDLRSISVGHSQWFPAWVHKHPELRYTNWDEVKFYPRGYKNSKTEAMPLLVSQSYRFAGHSAWLMGGVSLADEEVVQGRAALPKTLEGSQELELRSGLDYSDFGSNGQRTLKTLDQTEHVFADNAEGVTSTVSKARPAAKFRGADSELANLEVGRSYAQAGPDLNIKVQVGGVNFGEFSSLEAGDTLRVGFRELEIDRAHDLAETTSAALARNDSPARLLAENPNVQYVLRMGCDDCYAVKLRGSDQWLKMAKETDPTVNLRDGWQARTAYLDSDKSPTINFAFVDDAKFQQELQSAGYVHLPPEAQQRAGAAMEISNRGPPNGATPVQVTFENSTVSASRGADGTIYVDRAKLPADLGQNPAKLIAAVNDDRNASSRLVEQIRGNDYRTAADEIAADPISAKRTLDAVSDHALDDADRALAAGNDGEAVRSIDSYIALQRPSPDMLARRAIAEVKADPDQAVESIRQALAARMDSPNDLLRTVNARLAHGDLSPAEMRNLQEIATMIDLRDDKWISQIIPFSDDGNVEFRIRLINGIRAEPVPVGAGNPDGPWYALENPGLQSQDGPTRIRLVIDTTVQREVGALPRWDLAWAKPHAIETADGKRWVEQLTREQMVARLRPPQLYTPMRSGPDCSDPNNPECQDLRPSVKQAAIGGLN